MIIAHRDGDPVRFPNTKCVWTPDISSPEITEDAGYLVLAGKERKEGIVSKLERDIKSERTFTSMADKIYFMCELSWEMFFNDKMSLNYRSFPDRLKNLFGPILSEQKELDHWHYDMMGNTLFVRNDDGDYSPAHRSLIEFFVAFKALL